MTDLEAVLADVSYLMAMEMSKSTPAARASKKITLPDPSIRSIMTKYLEKNGEITFDRIFNQRIGFLIFKDYCLSLNDENIQSQVLFYEEIKNFEKVESDEDRIKTARSIYDQYIMKELLSHTHSFSKKSVENTQELILLSQKTHQLPSDCFTPYVGEIYDFLKDNVYSDFLKSSRFTRYCQWKNLEFNINLTTNDFSVHRIIGRGGFGEVYGCRKADSGKMYAMKCLDKKRIKLKGGETLALNERVMLSIVSTGEGCPFIVCMTYAFQTPEKLCFILDLMNGGDLHYHLTQHNVFSEQEVRFYAAEVILGLEHMHNRFIVYRDLKPANILLDEHGHIRISDLGLACDFSRKKPHASVGTHGYMAPEVLQKGCAYDSSADWFSFGCMLYKLLRGHSPFRQTRNKDKLEIDRMTMTLNIEFPEILSAEMRSLLEGLLSRDVDQRLGCMGRQSYEVKEHPFFEGVDWQQVYLQKYPPPLIPPRGEVNAADAFDIGSFDEEDTKGIKLTDADQDLYKNFSLVVSERWQMEMCETVFEVVNSDSDKLESKKKQKMRSFSVINQNIQLPASLTSLHQNNNNNNNNNNDANNSHHQPHDGHQKNHLVINANSTTNIPNECSKKSMTTSSSQPGPERLASFEEIASDCIVEGDILRLGGPFLQSWQRKYLKLYPNRLELFNKSRDGFTVKKGVEFVSMLDIKEINPNFQRIAKMDHCISMSLKGDQRLIISSNDRILITQWLEEIQTAYQQSLDMVSQLTRKAHKMYGADSFVRSKDLSSSKSLKSSPQQSEATTLPCSNNNRPISLE